MFQSSPGFEAGRYSNSTAELGSIGCSNPRPVLRPGATSRRSDGPVRRTCSNPRPVLRPGATLDTIGQTNRPAMFQSSPGFEAGRYPESLMQQGFWGLCSNPRPVLRPGATCWGCHSYPAIYPSSNPRPVLRPGATCRPEGRAVRAEFQSSPGFEAGRYPPTRTRPERRRQQQVPILARF